MLQKFTQPKPVAWFFFLLCFSTTIAMGTWQVERLKWKEGLIAELAEANAEAPLTKLPSDAADLKPLQFRTVSLHGTWLGDTEFHITPRYLHDQFGYALVTPLKLSDGRIVLINRGWIPGKKKLLETRPETKVHGSATVTGLVRIDSDRGYFTPANSPEKNIWFARDIDAMAAYAKLNNVIPAMVDQTAPVAPKVKAANTPATAAVTNAKTDPAQPAATLKLPVPSDGTIRLRNDHLSYILTWYGIALGILVIFVTYHRKKA